MITEVTITEGSAVTQFAQYCPAGVDTTAWLEKLVRDVLLAPANMRMVRLAGTSWTLDRANITLVVVTRTP